MPSVWLFFSSPAECPTMGHIVLDLTSLAYQPTTKASDRPGNQRRHVSFSISERKRAYPAHTRPHMEKITNFLCIVTMPFISEEEDTQPHVRPTTRKEPLEEGRDQATDDEDLAPLVPSRPSRPPQAAQRQKKTGTTSMAGIQLLYWNKGCQGTRASEQRIPQFWTKKSESEALRNMFNKLSDERNLKDLSLETLPYVHRAVQEEDH